MSIFRTKPMYRQTGGGLYNDYLTQPGWGDARTYPANPDQIRPSPITRTKTGGSGVNPGWGPGQDPRRERPSLLDRAKNKEIKGIAEMPTVDFSGFDPSNLSAPVNTAPNPSAALPPGISDIQYQPYSAEPAAPSVLPGQSVQAETDSFLYDPDTPAFDYDPNLDQQVANYADWIAQPGNLPQYYVGNTIAAPGPATEDAWARYTDAAGERDTITNQLIADYQDQLDPNSELNQQYAQNAADRAGSAFFGAGTPGSARGLYSSNVAAQDIYRDRRDKALSGLGAQRGELEKGADLISRVGKEQRDIGQENIDADIRRWNYYQNLPQQVQEQLLGASSIQTGLASEAGIPQLPNFGIEFDSSYGDLYNNEGGALGDPMMMQEDPMMMQDPMMDQGMGMDPMAPTAAPVGPMAPPAPGIMGPAQMPAPMPMMMEEPKSGIDMIEDVLADIVASSDGDITIKRTSKKKGGK